MGRTHARFHVLCFSPPLGHIDAAAGKASMPLVSAHHLAKWLSRTAFLVILARIAWAIYTHKTKFDPQ
jgi:hypothetical protein